MNQNRSNFSIQQQLIMPHFFTLKIHSQFVEILEFFISVRKMHLVAVTLT